MKLEQLIDQFELVTDNEEGLQQLKNLILNLAFRGKLTDQNTAEKSGEELLEQIRDEKQRMYDNGEIRKPKELSAIELEEMPYRLPQGWTWCRLGDTYHNWGNKTPDTDFQYIDVSSIDNEKGEIGSSVELISPEDAPSRAKRIVKEGTVLYSTVRPYLLNVAIYKGDFDYEPIASTAFEVIHPHTGVFNKYIYSYLRSPIFTEYVDSTMVGVAYPAVNKGDMIEGYFPLPPLEEQQRIVQKIETFFTQVDELEQKVRQDREVNERLQVAVLDDLQVAETPEASKKSWQRLTDHFEQIYHKPEHIDQLKQAILNEAIRGRLVPQDPSDEPVEKQLERIKEKKQRLYDEGEIRKPKDLPEISEEDKPFELPKGWVWARVGDIAKVVEYGTSQKSHKEPDGVPMLRMGNIDEYGNLTLDNLKYVDAEIDDLPRLYLKDKDLLFNRTNSYELVGKMGLYHGEDDKYTFASYLIRVQLFHELTVVEYLHNFINSENCRKVEIEPEITQQTNQANFNGTKLQHIRVPLPPLDEQKRIMKEVNDLFSWCDDLKEKLSRSQQTDQRLLEALVNGALEEDEESKETEEATIYQIPDNRIKDQKLSKVSGMNLTDVHAGIMARILNGYERYRGEKSHLGRTKMEKVCHIIESHSGIDLGRKPKRMQFGSADYGRLRGKVEPRADKLNWFTAEEKSDGVHYSKGTQFHEPFQKLGHKLIDKADEIDRIIELFVPLSTRDAEVRQTVYAAWHDLIAYGKDPSEEEIVIFASTEKYWAKEKEDIPKEEFYEAIDWLRENDLVPDGKGKLTLKK